MKSRTCRVVAAMLLTGVVAGTAARGDPIPLTSITLTDCSGDYSEGHVLCARPVVVDVLCGDPHVTAPEWSGLVPVGESIVNQEALNWPEVVGIQLVDGKRTLPIVASNGLQPVSSVHVTFMGDPQHHIQITLKDRNGDAIGALLYP